MRLLVTGTSGQLAQSLLQAGHAAGVDVFAFRRPQLDLTIPSSIRKSLDEANPDVVINAAAYTAVDKAESEPELAEAVNAAGSGELARQCERLGVALIHISTDYVFDGTKPAPYVEEDQVSPANAYGRSKLGGERAVAANCQRHVILRTSWVFSPFGTNFVRTLLRHSNTRAEFDVVDDQLGSPTYAPHLAQALFAIAGQLPRRGGAATATAAAPWGLYHACGGGETTWCGFAREIFRVSVERGGPFAKVNAITTADYPTAARRPANSRLDCSRLDRTFNIKLPDWREGVDDCVGRLLK